MHFCIQKVILQLHSPKLHTKIPWHMIIVIISTISIIVIISTISIRLINNSLVFICFLWILFVTPSHVDNDIERLRIFGLAQSQKIGDITFYRNLLGLVWFLITDSGEKWWCSYNISQPAWLIFFRKIRYD